MNTPDLPLNSPLHGSFGQGHTDPESVILHKKWARLSTNPHGEMDNGQLEGFFYANAQFITHYKLRLDGNPLEHTFTAQLGPNEWSGVFLAPGSMQEGNLQAGIVPQGALEVRVLRRLEESWHESIRVRSYSNQERYVDLTIELGCPIGDVEFEDEMKTTLRSRLEGIVPLMRWNEGVPHLRYERNFGPRRHAPTEELRALLGPRSPLNGQSVTRAVEVHFSFGRSGTIPRFRVEEGPVSRIIVRFGLKPKAHLDLDLVFQPEVNGLKARKNAFQPIQPVPRSQREVAPRHTRIFSGNSTLNMIVSQALGDLESLKLPVFGETALASDNLDAFNAGIPRYIGIFSRDILTTAWQSALFTPKYIEPALSRVALYKGVRWDPWRDEEPDRIPHERRLNPKAEVGETNRELYYGDVVSTLFWIFTLASAYNWIGEKEILKRQAPVFDSCCRWLLRKLNEGDGLVYYAPALPAEIGSNRHHAWKDSGDAIVDSHGRIRVPPLACVEIQGYAFIALLSAAEVSLVTGHPLKARGFFRLAMKLKERFNRSFWMPKQRFFATALDGKGKPVDSITSNIGHCIGTGIIDPDKLPLVVARLFSSDMYSGWGIRTLSSENPAYDPFSYHRGSVWPVENATMAGGLAVTGYYDHAIRLVSSQFALATLFHRMRLPEVISGHPRNSEYPVPGLYLHSNLLQAWSVSAIPLMLQVIMGLRPVAPLRTLILKPYLPRWLPWIEIHDFQVGDSLVSLRFWRDEKGKSHWRILHKDGRVLVIEQAPSLHYEASLWERIRDGFRSVA